MMSINFELLITLMTLSMCADVPKSATRKAQRGLPTTVYFFRVSRTTLRGQKPLHILPLCLLYLIAQTFVLIIL